VLPDLLPPNFVRSYVYIVRSSVRDEEDSDSSFEDDDDVDDDIDEDNENNDDGWEE
jgi:hypothetical protein